MFCHLIVPSVLPPFNLASLHMHLHPKIAYHFTNTSTHFHMPLLHHLYPLYQSILPIHIPVTDGCESLSSTWYLFAMNKSLPWLCAIPIMNRVTCPKSNPTTSPKTNPFTHPLVHPILHPFHSLVHFHKQILTPFDFVTPTLSSTPTHPLPMLFPHILHAFKYIM